MITERWVTVPSVWGTKHDKIKVGHDIKYALVIYNMIQVTPHDI
jgi:hypothetical protein